MKQKFFSQKGSVLLLIMIMMLTLLVIATVFMGKLVTSMHVHNGQHNEAQALNLAEAGIDKALYYLNNTAPDGSTNGSWRTASAYPNGTPNTPPASCTATDPCQEALSGGTYTLWLGNAVDGNILIVSRGVYGPVSRTISVEASFPGPAGWWKFDEASSGTCWGKSILDASPNGNTGTCHNGPVWGAGQVGPGALSFNSGSSQYVSLRNNFPSAPLTITAWVYGSSWASVWPFSSGTVITFFGPANGCNPSSQVFYISTAGYASFDTGCGPVLTGSTVIPLGQWHHVAAVIDAAETTTLYLDGNFQGSANTTGGNSVGTPANALIGASWAGGMMAGYFSGNIDDLRVYNYALSAAEVLKIYQGNVAYYPVGIITGTWKECSLTGCS